ncbi:hypothetical protein MJH12_10760, partial [bacterium]|nr:hypothetical protein [bacterium]
MDIVVIKAAAELSINTSSSQEYIGVPANTLFKLELDGALKIIAFDVSFKGGISIVDNIFELRIDEAKLDFFGALTLNISGYLRSDGNFSLTGAVDFGIDMGIIKLSAGMSMTISNSKFAASVYGSLDISIDMGFFEINETLAGFSGEIEITASSAYLAAKVTVAGISVSGDYAWSWGAPPVISHKVGDTVYLHMGDRGHLRGELYDDIDNEAYTITETDGVLKVSALGELIEYTGVKHIVASGGGGNDAIHVGQDVTADLQFDGGDGKDSFTIIGGASTSIIDAGAGTDTIVGGFSSGIHYYGGSGDDSFIGGDGDEYIDMGTGNNTIIGGGGRDTIHLYLGTNNVKSGSGDDTITIHGGVNTIDLGAGNDTVYSNVNTYTTIIGGTGYDQVIVDTFSSSKTIFLKDHELDFDTLNIKFDDTLDRILLKDTSSETILKNNADKSESWGATSLSIHSSGFININNVTLIAPTAHFSFVAAGIEGT